MARLGARKMRSKLRADNRADRGRCDTRGVAHVTTSKIHASSATRKTQIQTILYVKRDRKTFMNLDVKEVDVHLPQGSNSRGGIGVQMFDRGVLGVWRLVDNPTKMCPLNFVSTYLLSWAFIRRNAVTRLKVPYYQRHSTCSGFRRVRGTLLADTDNRPCRLGDRLRRFLIHQPRTTGHDALPQPSFISDLRSAPRTRRRVS